jgi:TonB family protein
MNATATSASVGIHVGIAILVMLGASRHLEDGAHRSRSSIPLFIDFAAKGTTSGGRARGSGNGHPDPPSAARNVGDDRIALSRPSVSDLNRDDVEPRLVLQPVDAPVTPQSTGLTEMPGAITAIVTPETDSRGSGRGPAGTGSGRRGNGDGDGVSGRGFGPGGGPGPGGLGDGPGGVDPPVVIKQVKPAYTTAALQARLQGVVLMEAVVLPDGSVGDVRILRSLDRQMGLDDEAIKAVKQWRFRPGTRLGRPVPFLVNIELTFTLR